jgi:hypothetical protein
MDLKVAPTTGSLKFPEASVCSRSKELYRDVLRRAFEQPEGAALNQSLALLAAHSDPFKNKCATTSNVEALFTLERELSSSVMDAHSLIPSEYRREEKNAVRQLLKNAQSLISEGFLNALERNDEPLKIVRLLYENK